jgi:hypothetical protein
MSQPNLYVKPENQQLLWGIMNKNPYFVQIPNGYREQWFSTIIGQFYERTPYVPNAQVLQNINRDTIAYMVDVLKKKNEPTRQNAPLIRSYQVPESVGREGERKVREDQFNNMYGERQRQYENMFAKPPPPEVNFEKLDDHPISNMEELLEKHKREREAEIKQFSPMPDFIAPSPQSNMSPYSAPVQPPVLNSPEKLRIIPTAGNVPMNEVINIDTTEHRKQEKNVTWSENITVKLDSRDFTETSEIVLLKSRIEEMYKQMQDLQMEMRELKESKRSSHTQVESGTNTEVDGTTTNNN